MGHVVDIEEKGNVVRFYIGSGSHIDGHVDIMFPFDWSVNRVNWSLFVVTDTKDEYTFKIGEDVDSIIKKGLIIRDECNFASLI